MKMVKDGRSAMVKRMVNYGQRWSTMVSNGENNGDQVPTMANRQQGAGNCLEICEQF